MWVVFFIQCYLHCCESKLLSIFFMHLSQLVIRIYIHIFTKHIIVGKNQTLVISFNLLKHWWHDTIKHLYDERWEKCMACKISSTLSHIECHKVLKVSEPTRVLTATKWCEEEVDDGPLRHAVHREGTPIIPHQTAVTEHQDQPVLMQCLLLACNLLLKHFCSGFFHFYIENTSREYLQVITINKK